MNSGLGTTPEPGAPTKWKQLIMAIMLLYPTAAIAPEILVRFVKVRFALWTPIPNAIAMSLVMLVWLPRLLKLLGSWLLPVEPLVGTMPVSIKLTMFPALLQQARSDCR